MNDLLSCPFCGGESLHIFSSAGLIACRPCGAQTATYSTRDAAIAAWNCRVDHDHLAAALLKAEESLKVALNDLDEWVACKDSLEKAGFNMDDTADRAEIVRTALAEIKALTGG